MAKKRSPAHPAFGLQSSIGWAKEIHSKEGEHFVPMEAVAVVWGLSAGASNFAQRLSSLKQYGLLEEKGAKEDREFKLTSLALDILLHTEGSDERGDAIQTALMKPSMHVELLEKYEGTLPPQDASIRSYLLRGREGATFNVKQVDGFIERFRSSIEFTSTVSGQENLHESVVDTSNNETGPDDSGNSDIKVGSFVQWTSNGVMQFQSPLPISKIEIDEDGKRYAFFEETKNYAPMSELTIENPRTTGPAPPVLKSLTIQKLAIGREETSLDEGQVTLTWPLELSTASVDDFEYWVTGLIKKARRRAKKFDSIATD